MSTTVEVKATFTTVDGLAGGWVYLDGAHVFDFFTTSIDQQISVTPGSHVITVKGWDKNKAIYSGSVSVTAQSGGPSTCSAPSSPGVHICSPTGGDVPTTVELTAALTTVGGLSGGWVYLDGAHVFAFYTPSIDRQITMTPGAHTITVKGWDKNQAIYSASVSVLAQSTTTGLGMVNHIIFLAQENRGFDHYFGQLNQYRATLGLPTDVDGTPSNASNPCYKGEACGFNGQTVMTPFHLQTMCVENPSPSWNEAHVDWNLNNPTSATATLDGFVTTAAGDAISSGFHDTLGRRTMGYYNASDLPYYYFMASQFATADRWFSPVMSRTHPNRMYLMAATSQGHAYPIPSGGAQLTAKTIFQELDEHGITWKIYTDGPRYLDMFTYGNTHAAQMVPISQYYTDLANHALPQVAMIEPGTDEGADEHPATNPNSAGPDIQIGAKWVSKLINGLMTSSSWKDSIFILTYDEEGGFYDHVPPMSAPNPDGIPPRDLQPNDICTKGEVSPSNCDFNKTGYRVPMIVVSPFTKPHYVSHTPMDYTAILKLIETRFNLNSLTARDAAQPDMTEFFDFTNIPWATPPTPPTQQTTGACYLDKLP